MNPWGLAGGLLGGLFGRKSTPKPTYLDYGRIEDYLSPTQGLVDEQIGISRQLMDPDSSINMQMRNMLSQNAMNQGAQLGSQMQKLGAMTGVSPGQVAMQQRMSMNQAASGVNESFLNALQQRFSQGTGLMGNMSKMQLGLDENLANAYVQNVNALNRYRQQKSSRGFGGLMGGFDFGNAIGGG